MDITPGPGSPIAIGVLILGGANGAVLFIDAGRLAQDATNFLWNNTSKHLILGPGGDTIARQTVYTPATDEAWFVISGPSAGAKSFLVSPNGFSVTETRPAPSDFHFANLSGRVFGAIQEDLLHTLDVLLDLQGGAPNKTVPLLTANLAATPAAGSGFFRFRDSALVASAELDRDTRLMLSATGVALPANLGTGNIKQSALGFWLVLENSTHLKPTGVDVPNQGADYKIDVSGTTTGFQVSQAGVKKFRVDVNGETEVQGFKPGFVSKNANYTATAADRTIRMDATGGNRTVTLPAIVAAVRGREYVVKKQDASANTVTIAAAGGETIDGAATQVITVQFKGFVVQAPDTGLDWAIIGAF